MTNILEPKAQKPGYFNFVSMEILVVALLPTFRYLPSYMNLIGLTGQSSVPFSGSMTT